MRARREPVDEEGRIPVGVHRHAGHGLAGAMQPVGVGQADVDPGPDRPGQVADRDRRLVGLRQASRERDALGELERVREDAGHQVLRGLGRMSGHPERQRLVDVAVRVGQLDVEGVDRRGEGHGPAVGASSRVDGAS